jgi:hypothetical protein
MNAHSMWKPALTAGVLLGIFSAVPPLSFFNLCCCAWVLGGGVLAAHLYIKNSTAVVTLGTGVGLGIMTGAIGGIVTTVFNIPVQLLMNTVFARYAEQARQMLSEMPNLPPALREIILSSGNVQLTPLSVILAMFLNIIIFGLIAMIGGVLGVAIFEKRKIEVTPPVSQPPVNIPPPPPPDYPEP